MSKQKRKKELSYAQARMPDKNEQPPNTHAHNLDECQDHESCRQLLSTLGEYVDGTLSGDLCAELERHMKDCQRCRVVVDMSGVRYVSYMAIGVQDPVLGEPAMRALHRCIRNCPEPLLVPTAGHFVQEWGEPIARAALRAFGTTPPAAS